jgi:hypothetical protein
MIGAWPLVLNYSASSTNSTEESAWRNRFALNVLAQHRTFHVNETTG